MDREGLAAQLDAASQALRATQRLSISNMLIELTNACVAAGGKKPWAEAHGICRKYVDNVLQGRAPMPPSMFLALGFRRVVEFERINSPRTSSDRGNTS